MLPEDQRLTHLKLVPFWKSLWRRMWIGCTSTLLVLDNLSHTQLVTAPSCCCIISSRIQNDMYANHLFPSLTDLKKLCKWLAWYLRKSISSARFLSSLIFLSFICFYKASFFFFNSYTFYSHVVFFYSNYIIVVWSYGAPCSAWSCFLMEKVSELS